MSDLTCRDLIDFLDDYTAGTQPGDVRRRFEEHLKVCRACRDYLRTYQDAIALSKAALSAGDVPVPPGVPSALINAVLAARRKHA